MTGPVTTNPRKRVVAVRLTESEGAALDDLRGEQNPSNYLRDLLRRDIERRAQANTTIFEITVNQHEQKAPDGSTVLPYEGPLTIEELTEIAIKGESWRYKDR
jgi:hypothetical protein